MDATRSCAGWSLWLLLVLAAHAVSSQVEVKGVVGDDVLLPCSYPGLQLPPEGLNVSWRNQGEQMVLGIDGAQNLTHQDQKFRGRVTSFPHLYRHGNFSVVLQDVQQLDGGLYECHMVVDIRQRVRLHVTEGEPVPPQSSGGGHLGPTSVHLSLLFVLLLLLLIR